MIWLHLLQSTGIILIIAWWAYGSLVPDIKGNRAYISALHKQLKIIQRTIDDGQEETKLLHEAFLNEITAFKDLKDSYNLHYKIHHSKKERENDNP